MSDTYTTTPADERRATNREEGQALVEYALILAFVSITAVALTPVGQVVAQKLTDLAAAI
jgi:Flp pilus assembly pilin Flp